MEELHDIMEERGTHSAKGSSLRSAKSQTTHSTRDRPDSRPRQSRKNVANYLQCTALDEGYHVAETVRTGKLQTIALPPPIDTTASDAKDQKIIREEAVQAIEIGVTTRHYLRCYVHLVEIHPV